MCFLGKVSSHWHKRRLSDFCGWKNKTFLWAQLAWESFVCETQREIQEPELHEKRTNRQ